MSSEPSPHYVDLHVGARLRLRRKSLGLSQMVVAAAVGLTFQQLQKYERGANRISASKLHALAHVLTTSVGWFFEGLPDPVAPDHPLAGDVERVARVTQAFVMSSEGVELARAFPAIPSAARRQILDLMRAMAEAGGEEAGAG
jgi:transcriptional regulator with XRE-family HTH domain